MNITITGSKGFIGSHLKSRILAEGHSITEWDRNLGNDIANFSIDYIKETEVFSEPSVIAATNMVIHLAASADVRKSVEEPDHYWENNVINTKKVQDICFNMKIPMLYASSSCVHAWSLSPYGTSKKINELTAYPGQIGLRFTTVYGSGARDTMLIPRILNNTLKYTTNHRRDFIYINDVIDAIMFFVNRVKENIVLTNYLPAYDIGTGRGVVVHELVSDLGYKNIPFKEGDPCEAPDNTANIKDMQDLGWEPKTDLGQYMHNQGYGVNLRES